MGDKSPKNKEKKKKKADKKVTNPIASSAATVTKAQKTYQGYEIVLKNFYVYCLKVKYYS